jgi:hypothetical protein
MQSGNKDGNTMFCTDTTHSAKAVEFLRVQHRRLIQLFVDYFAARSESRRHDLRPILCHAVKVHLTLEADCFLPLLSLAVGDTSICAAAAKERQLIESLIDEVEYPDPGAYGISEQVHVLSGLVKKHVLTAEKPAGLFERAALSNLDDAGMVGLLRRRSLELRYGPHTAYRSRSSWSHS